MKSKISESVISRILDKIYIYKKPLTWREHYIVKTYVEAEGLRQNLITHLEEEDDE